MNLVIRNRKDLRAAISELELRKAEQERQLLEELHAGVESLRPMNLVKRAVSSPSVRSNALKAAVGIGAGMLTQNLLLGPATGPVKKILGNVLKFSVAAIVARSRKKKIARALPK